MLPALNTYFLSPSYLEQWAKSEIKGSAERAVKLLREMSDYNVTPGMLYSYLLHLFSS